VEGKPGTPAHAVGAFLAIGEGYVDFAVRHPAHFRVMFGPCLLSEGFAPCLSPSGRDAFQILVEVLDGLLAAGVIAAGSRPGAEFAAWAMVHGIAALLVDGAMQLATRERQLAFSGAARTMLLGLGADPALLPPAPATISFDPRPEDARTGRAAG
jgi:hypothetical protein